MSANNFALFVGAVSWNHQRRCRSLARSLLSGCCGSLDSASYALTPLTEKRPTQSDLAAGLILYLKTNIVLFLFFLARQGAICRWARAQLRLWLSRSNWVELMKLVDERLLSPAVCRFRSLGGHRKSMPPNQLVRRLTGRGNRLIHAATGHDRPKHRQRHWRLIYLECSPINDLLPRVVI